MRLPLRLLLPSGEDRRGPVKGAKRTGVTRSVASMARNNPLDGEGGALLYESATRSEGAMKLPTRKQVNSLTYSRTLLVGAIIAVICILQFANLFTT